MLNSSANPTAKQNSKNNKTLTETKLTDFFPVRRSVRKTKKEVIEEQNLDIQKAIIDGREEGLAVMSYKLTINFRFINNESYYLYIIRSRNLKKRVEVL